MYNPNFSPAHFTTLRTIFEHINPYVNIFIHAVDYLAANPIEEVHICITTSRYNIPTVNKVVMIILGEPGEVGNCDVIV